MKWMVFIGRKVGQGTIKRKERIILGRDIISLEEGFLSCRLPLFLWGIERAHMTDYLTGA